MANNQKVKKNDRNISGTAGQSDEFTETFAYILAGFEKNLDGFDIFSLSLQRLGDDDYRVVCRGRDWRERNNPLRVVSFTNASTAFDCLAELENGLRTGTIKFSVDRYAKADTDNDAAKATPTGFSFID